MEKREILAVIIAAVSVCMLIGIIRMVKGEDPEPNSESSELVPVMTNPEVPVVTTDYWDYVRELQSAASSSETGEAVSGTNEGVELITAVSFTDQTAPSSDDLWNGVMTIMPESSLTEDPAALTTTTTTTTTAAITSEFAFFVTL